MIVYFSFHNELANASWAVENLLKAFDMDELLFVGNDEYLKQLKANIAGKEKKVECYLAEFPNIKIEETRGDYFSCPSGDLDRGRFNAIKDIIKKCFSDIKKKYVNIDFVITEYPDIILDAKIDDLMVICMEPGPLKSPVYIENAYFELAGLVEPNNIMKRFENLESFHKFDMLQKKEILSIIADSNYLGKVLEVSSPAFEIGIPIQRHFSCYTEHDPNKIIDLLTIISDLMMHYDEKQILFRKHPGGIRLSIKNIRNDSSKYSIDFIKKCKSIISLNSDLSLEAILHDRDTYVFGKSIFKPLSASNLYLLQNILDDREKLFYLNFLVFCYFVPKELLEQKAYYYWRLSGPSEMDIFSCHLNFYLQKKGYVCLDKFDQGIKIIRKGLNP